MKNSVGPAVAFLMVVIAFAATPSTAQAASKTLFEDKFQRTSIGSDWEIHDCKDPAEGPSNWTLKDKALAQTSNIYRGGPKEYEYFEGTNIVTTKGSDWADYEFTVTFCIAGDNGGVGFLFRYQDEEHYYRFIMVDDPGNHGPFQKLQVKNGDAYTTLAENKAGYETNGRIGLMSYAEQPIFDDVKVVSK